MEADLRGGVQKSNVGGKKSRFLLFQVKTCDWETETESTVFSHFRH